jgi:hypothetical protein
MHRKKTSSATHLQCTLDFLHFGHQGTDVALDNQLKFNNSEHNKRVRRNRDILKRLIDVTCLLANQELPFRGHDESDSSLNRGNYIEFLQLLKDYDPLLNDHLETDIFKGTSLAIQNNLIKAIHDVMLDEISRQIQEAPYVAVMLDETSDIQMVSQLATVLRYIHDGNIQERFVGFTDISADRSSDGLFSHVQNVVSKFHLESKLVAQAYDGASVMSGHLNDLQHKVSEIYPHALHVHCYAHVLNLILSQSLNNIEECSTFFSSLNGIATFTSHSNKRTYVITEYLTRKIPSLAVNRRSFSSCLVNIIEQHRILIMEYFGSTEGQEGWTANDRMAAIGYKKFLKKFQTVFLLKLFSSVFAHSDILFHILQTKGLDIVFCATKIKEFQSHLQNEHDTGFPLLWKLSNDGRNPKKRRGQNST